MNIQIETTVDANENGTFSNIETVNEGTPEQANYKYVLTHNGALGSELSITSLIDDRGTASTADDIDVLALGTLSGDTDGDGKLDASETWTLILNNVAIPPHNVSNSLVSTATVKAADSLGQVTTDSDMATVTFSGLNPKVNIVMTVDANEDGVFSATEHVNEGTPESANYKYELTNVSPASTDPLSVDNLVDDRGTASTADDIHLVTDGVLASGVSLSGDTDSNGRLDRGETWTYVVNGVAIPAGDATGPDLIHKATVNVTDDEGKTHFHADTAKVEYDDVKPDILVSKLVDADGDGIYHDSETIPEGATRVPTYQVTITNNSNSGDQVTISRMDDDRFTDDAALYQLFLAANGGSRILAPGQSVTFTYQSDDQLVLDGGGSFTNEINVYGEDDEDNDFKVEDQATVLGDPVDPRIHIVKTVDTDTDADAVFHDVENAPADAASTADYMYVLTNTGAVTDPLTITSLIDDRGTASLADDVDVLALGTLTKSGGDLDALLEVGETWTYVVSDVGIPAHANGTRLVNTATVTARDDENVSVSDSDTATLEFGKEPGVRGPGNCGPFKNYWDGIIGNETRSGPAYPSGELLAFNDINGNAPGNGQSYKFMPYILLGDLDGNGQAGPGETTVRIALMDAMKMVGLPTGDGGGKSFDLLGHVIAAQLNLEAGNNMGDGTGETPKFFLGEGTEWILKHLDSNNDGVLTLTEGKTYIGANSFAFKSDAFNVNDFAYDNSPKDGGVGAHFAKIESGQEIMKALVEYNNHGTINGVYYAPDADIMI